MLTSLLFVAFTHQTTVSARHQGKREVFNSSSQYPHLFKYFGILSHKLTQKTPELLSCYNTSVFQTCATLFPKRLMSAGIQTSCTLHR